MSGDGEMVQIPQPVREAAALWFARLRGPDAEGWKTEFEAWRKSDRLHAKAYDRASGWFALGAQLKHEGGQADVADDRHGKRSWTLPASGLAIAASIGVLFALASHAPWLSVAHVEATAARPVTYAAASQQQRTIGLADGSTITLDAASSVSVDIRDDRRLLKLVVGRARFDVAHERRPFVVTAGPSIVTAHGTVFDVAFAPGHPAVVRLLRGAVDVEGAPLGVHRIHQSLAAGDQVTVEDSTQIGAPSHFTIGQTQWLTGLIDYDHARLDAVLAQADRQSQTQIVLADTRSAGLAVSGSFRIDDSPRLASELATLFNLDARPQADGRIVLERR